MAPIMPAVVTLCGHFVTLKAQSVKMRRGTTDVLINRTTYAKYTTLQQVYSA